MINRIIRLVSRVSPRLARDIAWLTAYSFLHLGCGGATGPAIDGMRADPVTAEDAGQIEGDASPTPAEDAGQATTPTPDAGPVVIDGGAGALDAPVTGIVSACTFPDACTGVCDGIAVHGQQCRGQCVGTCAPLPVCPSGCPDLDNGICVGACNGICNGTKNPDGHCNGTCIGPCSGGAYGTCYGGCL